VSYVSVRRLDLGLIWTTVLVLLVIGVALSTMVRARPTRSIAHVLHDAEQPDSKS